MAPPFSSLVQYPVITVRWAAVHAIAIPTVFFFGFHCCHAIYLKQSWRTKEVWVPTAGGRIPTRGRSLWEKEAKIPNRLPHWVLRGHSRPLLCQVVPIIFAVLCPKQVGSSTWSTSPPPWTFDSPLRHPSALPCPRPRTLTWNWTWQPSRSTTVEVPE